MLTPEARTTVSTEKLKMSRERERKEQKIEIREGEEEEIIERVEDFTEKVQE
jgi:hypothetical protein